LGKRATAAQRQQTAAATTDKSRNHAQLVRRERTGLDAAEHQPVVGEQLLLSQRKAADKLLGRVDAQAQELGRSRRSRRRRALQQHDLDVGIVFEGLAYELRFKTRFALQIQQL